MEERVEQSEDYTIHIVAKHLGQTDAIKNHILDKLSKLERLSHNVIDVVVRLDLQKTEHRCAIAMKVGHTKVQSHATTTDLYASIDKAIERMQAKLRKWKDKIQRHHDKGVVFKEVDVDFHPSQVSDVEEINEMIEEENQRHYEEAFAIPEVSKHNRFPIKTLTTEEAMMKMELSGDTFLIYRCEESQRIRVIYRRHDGSYGVVTPE